MNNFVYSATTNGFYISGLHGDIPIDAIAITEQYHDELLEKQGEGFEITANDKGYPIATPRPMATIEQLREAMSLTRPDAKIRLMELGLFTQINDAIMAMPDCFLKIKWTDADLFKRLDVDLCDFLHGMSMNDEQIDELFTL